MKFDKDNISALIGTIIVHLILFLLLYMCVLRTIVPNEDSGILVNFGEISSARGTFEPQYTANVQQMATVTPPQRPVPTAKEEVITQDEEESVKIPDKKEKKKEKKVTDAKKTNEKEKTAQKQIEEENRRRKEQEERRRREEAISNRVSNAFGMGNNSASNSHGDASTGKGNQGSPFGNSDTGIDTGTGGFGTFNLNGRSIGQGGLPRPAYSAQDEGRIVINITVDPNGNVILAEIGRGTNIDNASLRRSAIEAAKRAKFNKIKGTDNQSGTITYIYKLN